MYLNSSTAQFNKTLSRFNTGVALMSSNMAASQCVKQAVAVLACKQILNPEKRD